MLITARIPVWLKCFFRHVISILPLLTEWLRTVNRRMAGLLFVSSEFQEKGVDRCHITVYSVIR